MQAGDVPDTSADPSRLIAAIGPWRATPLAEGLAGFVHWLEGWNARGVSPRLALAAAA